MRQIKCKFCDYVGYGFSINTHTLTHFKREFLSECSVYFCETEEHFKELLKIENGEKAFAHFTFPGWVTRMWTEESFNRDAYFIFAPLDIEELENRATQAQKDLEIAKKLIGE